MTNYIVKEVPLTEQDKLLCFLENHWKRGHSLVVSPELLRFQHYNKHTNTLNFIAAENTSTLEYDAIIGYISTNQYDPCLLKNGDYWGAIWKIRDDISNNELNAVGFFIWKKLFKLPYFQSYAAIGISETAKQIYTVSRLSLGYLNHYFILNNQKTDFKIAANVSSEDKKKHTEQNI